MENEEDPFKKQQIVDARARNISHNVRCLECGSQSIEESQADIAVLLRKIGDGEKEYTDDDLDQIREEWAQYVANFIFRS